MRQRRSWNQQTWCATLIFDFFLFYYLGLIIRNTLFMSLNEDKIIIEIVSKIVKLLFFVSSLRFSLLRLLQFSFFLIKIHLPHSEFISRDLSNLAKLISFSCKEILKVPSTDSKYMKILGCQIYVLNLKYLNKILSPKIISLSICTTYFSQWISVSALDLKWIIKLVDPIIKLYVMASKSFAIESLFLKYLLFLSIK